MPKHDLEQTEFVNFYLPLSGKIKQVNRWVKFSAMIPLDEVQQCYEQSLSRTEMGAPAKSGRIAYGAPIVKDRLGPTDEETGDQIQENPYLQYFLGREEYRDEPLFDPSIMVRFRSRFTQEHHRRINERIIALATAMQRQKESPPPENGESPSNCGKLLVDATRAPAVVKLPTDLGLLDEAREKREKKQGRQDKIDRISIEGKFGNAKRTGMLDRVMAKLACTSESAIYESIVALNLDTWLRAVLFSLFQSWDVFGALAFDCLRTLRHCFGGKSLKRPQALACV